MSDLIHVVRAFSAQIDDVKKSERAIISRIGGMEVDRHRTRISPDGIDLSSYRQNPIVLHEHGRCPTRGTIPVGKNQWIKIDAGRMIAKTVFRDDPYSDALYSAYVDEWMRGWSINVISHEASPPTEEECRAAPSLLRDCDLVHRRSELLEYSTTSMPSHRQALTLMVERGIWVPNEAVLAAQHEYETSTRTSVAIPENLRFLAGESGGARSTTEFIPGHSPPIVADDDGPAPTPKLPYGACPHCGKPGVVRERCPNGNDTCAGGHVYPSKAAVAARTMTDSGGLATGGAAVKPRRVREGDDEDYDREDEEHEADDREDRFGEDEDDTDDPNTEKEVGKSRKKVKADAEREEEESHDPEFNEDDEDRDEQRSIARHVVEEDGKWYVLSKDRKKRLGGPYSSKEEADKRLGQIEYFKHGGRTAPTDVHKDPDAGKNSFKKNIREEDGKFVVTDDEGKHMGTYDTREEAEKRVKQIVWFKDHPDGKKKRSANEPVYFDGHGAWRVRGTDDIPFDDEAAARRFWHATQQPVRPVGDLVRAIDERGTQRNNLILDAMKEFLELKLEGRV